MTVGLIYIACLTLGLGYALWTGLLGPLFGGDGGGDAGDAGDIGGHLDVGDVGDAGGADFGVDVDAGGDFGIDADAGGDAGHGEFLDFDSSSDHGEIHFSPISPNVLATFLASFGALGVIGHYALDMAWWRSLILAISSGFILAGAFYYVIKSLYRVTQASSEAHVAELIGEDGELSVGIEPGGTGEIVYVVLGSRYQAPAKAIDSKQAIDRGSRVTIKRIEGGIYYVAPLHE